MLTFVVFFIIVYRILLASCQSIVHPSVHAYQLTRSSMSHKKIPMGTASETPAKYVLVFTQHNGRFSLQFSDPIAGRRTAVHAYGSKKLKLTEKQQSQVEPVVSKLHEYLHDKGTSLERYDVGTSDIGIQFAGILSEDDYEYRLNLILSFLFAERYSYDVLP